MVTIMKKRGLLRIFNNKRGISPLIATVLLIAFAVALGAVVMNWGRSYVEDMSEKSAQTSESEIVCAQEVSFEIQDIGTDRQICFDADEREIRVMLVNKGKIDLAGFAFQIIGAEGTGVAFDTENPGEDFEDVNYALPKNGFKTYTIEFPDDHGDITFIGIVPKIKSAGATEFTSCPDSIRKELSVGTCD